VRPYGVNELDKKTRSRLKEQEKMSKLFTKSRRTEGKKQFKNRVEMNKQRAKIKKKNLEKKYYDFDFKPKINKKRINIYSRNMPSNVIKELEKKKELKLRKKIRQQQETGFGSGINVPYKPSNKNHKRKTVTEMKFLEFTDQSDLPEENNLFDMNEEVPVEFLNLAKHPLVNSHKPVNY
jgi:hypothetical protein